MEHHVTRRDLLGSGFAAALGLALPAPRLQTVRLEDHLSVVDAAGSNVLIVSGKDEAVLIGGGAPESARDLLRLIAGVPTLINTHCHAPHTGVNERLGKRGAKIIAHENTK